MPTPTTPAQYALILIDLAERSGCDQDRLLAGTGLAGKPIGDLGARVNDRDFQQLVRNTMTLTGNSALGLHLGQNLNLGAHAVLGQAFMTCHNLREVIDLFLKYHHLLSANLELKFVTEAGRCWLMPQEPYGELPETFACELLFAAILNTLRGLLNAPALSLVVELPYPPPAHAEAYREVLGEQVYFDARRAGICFDAKLLESPLPSSNPALRKLYEQECARLLADLEQEESVARQTLTLLRKLEGQYPQMPQIARMLNYSPRTYRRRLQREQQSFQGLLDQVRAEHATRYLQQTQLPLSSIAYMIGFNDASNFRRAYQKWTGRTPGEARRDR